LPAQAVLVSLREQVSKVADARVNACGQYFSTDLSPMPRGGVLMMRANAASSLPFTINLKYARMSLISLRAKNERPPYTR
jgi:hypothetical protein